MELDVYRTLSVEEIAQLVRAAGPKVCVFPINGTRRWFMLEHMPQQAHDHVPVYLDIAGRRHVELYRLLFAHGLDTVLSPVFGPDLLERGGEYMQMAGEGLARLASHPDFLEFYDDCQVRVRFYGDYRRFFAGTELEHLSDLFDGVTERTRAHQRGRLFFGVCAHDATETIAAQAIGYYTQHGRPPDKCTLLTLYYGEYVPAVDLFIGFDKFCVFDMPLVATGNEDLYFTVSPSPYLDGRQLRDILYDHLYARRGGEPDYERMDAGDWDLMREFYHANLGRTLGVGIRPEGGEWWYPLPQVELPVGLTRVTPKNDQAE